jgi:23S rRNA pseudouridine2605 synthase
MAAERLQKLLARAGVGSRRACEAIILEGRVTVDGRTVIQLGTKADPTTQDVRLDGSRLRPERPEYWMLNKPKGVVCTNFDPAGRRRPIDLMPQTRARLFSVGRLDTESKGLLLMTNDGDFANRLTHPRYEAPKTYVATVDGCATPEVVRRLMRGAYLAEGRMRPAQVRVVKRGRMRSLLEITLREGRNRQIRRVLARLGHKVTELVRTRIGRISLRGLSLGQSRQLTGDEIEYLRRLPDTPPEAPPPRPMRPREARPREARPPEARSPRPREARPPKPRETWPKGRERRKPPEGHKAPGGGKAFHRKKGSRDTHDTDGVRQRGPRQRRHAGRGPGRGRGGRGGPPRRGNRPHRHSSQ